MSEFKQYRRTGLSEMRPYIEGGDTTGTINVSKEDLANGSPKAGDMIARNPKNHNDQWLVSEKYFDETRKKYLVHSYHYLSQVNT